MDPLIRKAVTARRRVEKLRADLEAAQTDLAVALRLVRDEPGLTLSEAARELGLSKQTVNTIINRH